MSAKHNRLRVISVVGTRPEIIRLSRVHAKLDLECNLSIVHTGQNYDYELNEIFFDQLEIKSPDYYLSAAKETAVKTMGSVLFKFDDLLDQLEPEAVLVLGDTNSAISLLAAKRRKIPTFHMEAGNRCYDPRVPEELNRRMVDHIADVNLTYSAIARENLLREGLPPDRTIRIGSPMKEVLDFYRSDIVGSDILDRLSLASGSYFVISVHREENVADDFRFDSVIKIINGLAATYQLPVIVSTHPRTRKRLIERESVIDSRVRFLKPLGFFDYNKLQICAKAVLSDSGTITEEASILGFNALNLRDTHERHEGMEQAVVMFSGLRWERVRQCLDILIDPAHDSLTPIINSVPDYEDANVSEKVVRIIHSYVGYVNRTVWRRNDG